MAKQTSSKKVTFEIGKKKKIEIERITLNMGKQRELFWIKYHPKTGHEYKLPAMTIEDLEEIIQEAKKLRG